MSISVETQKNRPSAGSGTSRLWRAGVCGIIVIISGALLGCSQDSSNAGDTGGTNVPVRMAAPAAATVVQVAMKNLQFDPLTITVKPGDAVEWTNEDMVPHTATSTAFDSGMIMSGKTWRHTFTNAGSFSYKCIFHPHMKGAVNVK